MVVFFWWAWRKRQELMTQFIRAQLLPNLTVGISTGRQKLRFILLILSTYLSSFGAGPASMGI